MMLFSGHVPLEATTTTTPPGKSADSNLTRPDTGDTKKPGSTDESSLSTVLMRSPPRRSGSWPANGSPSVRRDNSGSEAPSPAAPTRPLLWRSWDQRRESLPGGQEESSTLVTPPPLPQGELLHDDGAQSAIAPHSPRESAAATSPLGRLRARKSPSPSRISTLRRATVEWMGGISMSIALLRGTYPALTRAFTKDPAWTPTTDMSRYLEVCPDASDLETNPETVTHGDGGTVAPIMSVSPSNTLSGPSHSPKPEVRKKGFLISFHYSDLLFLILRKRLMWLGSVQGSCRLLPHRLVLRLVVRRWGRPQSLLQLRPALLPVLPGRLLGGLHLCRSLPRNFANHGDQRS